MSFNLTNPSDADHAVAHWNATVPVGTPVIRVDDRGHLHHCTTRSRAWVLPSGTAIVKVTGVTGGYDLSRIWRQEALEEVLEKHAPEGFDLAPLT